MIKHTIGPLYQKLLYKLYFYYIVELSWFLSNFKLMKLLSNPIS